MDKAADFFVSYTSADQAWAEWIAWQLEAEGYSVVVQAWDFTAGRDWAHEMQQATAPAGAAEDPRVRRPGRPGRGRRPHGATKCFLGIGACFGG
jgi:TIR domain